MMNLIRVTLLDGRQIETQYHSTVDSNVRDGGDPYFLLTANGVQVCRGGDEPAFMLYPWHLVREIAYGSEPDELIDHVTTREPVEVLSTELVGNVGSTLEPDVLVDPPRTQGRRG